MLFHIIEGCFSKALMRIWQQHEFGQNRLVYSLEGEVLDIALLTMRTIKAGDWP